MRRSTGASSHSAFRPAACRHAVMPSCRHDGRRARLPSQRRRGGGAAARAAWRVERRNCPRPSPPRGLGEWRRCRRALPARGVAVGGAATSGGADPVEGSGRRACGRCMWPDDAGFVAVRLVSARAGGGWARPRARWRVNGERPAAVALCGGPGCWPASAGLTACACCSWWSCWRRRRSGPRPAGWAVGCRRPCWRTQPPSAVRIVRAVTRSDDANPRRRCRPPSRPGSTARRWRTEQQFVVAHRRRVRSARATPGGPRPAHRAKTPARHVAKRRDVSTSTRSRIAAQGARQRPTAREGAWRRRPPDRSDRRERREREPKP